MAGGIGPTDFRLAGLADEAKVRPSHVWHLYCALAENPSLDLPTFAKFTRLEVRHLEAIVAALGGAALLPVPKRRRSPGTTCENERASRLPADFQVPEAWKSWAQVERGWTAEIVETEAATFVDHWSDKPGKDGLKIRWEPTWRNWIRRSYRPDGAYTSRDVEPLTPEQQRERVAAHAEFLARIGRD